MKIRCSSYTSCANIFCQEKTTKSPQDSYYCKRYGYYYEMIENDIQKFQMSYLL